MSVQWNTEQNKRSEQAKLASRRPILHPRFPQPSQDQTAVATGLQS
jgi:hypothetical protein